MRLILTTGRALSLPGTRMFALLRAALDRCVDEWPVPVAIAIMLAACVAAERLQCASAGIALGAASLCATLVMVQACLADDDAIGIAGLRAVIAFAACALAVLVAA